MNTEIKNKALDKASEKYLASMSNFLHVMRTNINGGIKNPLYRLIEEDDIDSIHHEIKENIYPRVMSLLMLCELIDVLESVMNEQREENVMQRLLQTNFFHRTQPNNSSSLISILEAEKETKERKILFVDISGDLETVSLVVGNGIFGTKLLHEQILGCMLSEALGHIITDNGGRTDIYLSNKNGILSISGKRKNINVSNWDKDLISPDKFKLFHLLLSYVGLGKFNVRTESDLVFVEFIYS
jgi:hypothetical protein